ncbi:Iron-sulfur cluster assembly scaffold protein IscU/NifU-like [hydrothermal vent metagenome]|uniref:Iron-sulfur cluster assembly scaffold protein IscU/NifU-like n=1 Tax=hydrothermal vent metagenome TaxID=652676 RepID=A0A1W1CKX1_9ZZZZ
MNDNEMTDREKFPTMTLVQKINTIDAIINDKIRDFLVKDNGDIELLNVEEKNNFCVVYVEYQGACVSCESSGNTLSSIENILQRMLSDTIKVVSV